MKKFVLPLIALALFASPLLAQQNTAPAPQGNEDNVVEEIVARVNNAIITRTDLRHDEAQIAQDAKQQGLAESQTAEREHNALRDLIDQQLLLQKAAELGITADAELVKRLDDLRKQMKASSMEDLQKMAESQGVSWEEFKKNTKNTILTQKVVGSEVGARIQITQADVQKYYDEHKADYSQPERVRLSEILIANDPNAPRGSVLEPSPVEVAAAQAKADEIYQQLQGGAKFDELARKVSNGTTADEGGDLGYFKTGDLAKQLEERTFGLKSGEYTPPIRTRQGFIILEVTDHIDAGTPPLEQVREQIQDEIYRQRVAPALREYLTKLRDDAYIDVKPGYADSGAGSNEDQLVYTAGTGPKTRQVRGKFGIGKKRTVIVTGTEGNVKGSTSELGEAKAEVVAKQKAAEERKAAAEAAAAKAAAKTAEKEKLSHMTRAQRKKYLAEKKHETKKEAKLKRKEERKQKQLAEEEAQRKAEQAAAAKAAKHGKKPKQEEAKAKQPAQADQQADSSQPKKKKFSWF